MDLTLVDLMDEEACYARLLHLLRPDGLECPSCAARRGLHVHRRHRAPVLDYRCAACGRVFNAWTGTALQGTHRRPSELLLILRGILLGVPTAQLARELGCQRAQLLYLRRRLLREEWVRGLTVPTNGHARPAAPDLPPAYVPAQPHAAATASPSPSPALRHDTGA